MTQVSSVSTLPVEGSAHSRLRDRASLTLTAIVALFLAFDAAVKLLNLPQAVDATVQLGYAAGLVAPIGALEAACLLLYSIPRTRVLGAVLLTGYLGGAVSTHLRAGDGLFGFVLFPVYVGVLAWAAVFLRDARVRALIPLRRP